MRSTTAGSKSEPRMPNFEFLWQEAAKQLAQQAKYEEESMVIQPTAGFVVKTRVIAASNDGDATAVGKKLFINICSDPAIPLPDHVEGDSENEVKLRLPASVGPLRPTSDQQGNECLACDVVFNPKLVELCKDDKETRTLLCAHAAHKLQVKYNLELSADFRFPNSKYKGGTRPEPQRVRRPPKAPLVETVEPAVQEQLGEAQQQPVTPLEAIAKPRPSKPEGTPAAASTSVPAKPREDPYAGPDFRAVCRYEDGREEELTLPATEWPSERPLPASLTLSCKLASGWDVTALELFAKSTAVLLRCQQPALNLQIDLPFAVDDAKLVARFSSRRRVLKLTAPVTGKKPAEAEAAAEKDWRKEIPLSNPFIFELG